MPYVSNILVDDEVNTDGNTTFSGGSFSSVSSDQVPLTGFATAVNMDFDSVGGLVTRRGGKSLVGAILGQRWEEMTGLWENQTNVWGSSLAAVTLDGIFFFDTGPTEYVVVGQSGVLNVGTEAAVFTVIAGSAYSGSNIYMVQMGTRLYYCDGVGALKYVDSAVANQSISAGRVTSITITKESVGYTAVPTIAFNSGVATATALLGYGGRVIGATVTAGGAGYSATTPPIITFSSGLATARANISQVPSKPKLLVIHKNRLICASADTAIPQDTIYVSDILDGESWDLASASKRIGGDNEAITAIFPWYGINIIIFKENSCYMMQADPLIPVSEWPVTIVSNSVGCIAYRSVANVGRDVLFLSRDGVRSFTQLNTAGMTSIGLPLSTPVQEIIDAMNLTYVSGACAIFYRNRYILSLPNDSSTTNATTIVFNALFQQWVGSWTGWVPKEFTTTQFSGKVRMSWADNSGRVWAWDDYTTPTNTEASEFSDDTTDYASSITTRGYSFGDLLGTKTGYHVTLHTENRFASTVVTAALAYDKDQSGTFTAIDSAISIANADVRVQKSFNLISYGPFNVIQFKFSTTRGRLVLRSLAATAFGEPIDQEL